jgi:hypothetical protein
VAAHGGGIMADEETTIEEAAVQAAQRNWLFDRMPEWVLDTLSNDQKEAIHAAAMQPAWNKHPVNIRLTIPFVGRYFYLTVVGGTGSRSNERRAVERHQYPVRTFSNAFFFVGVAVLFYVVALLGLGILSALVEF